jgi:hypothetical protein
MYGIALLCFPIFTDRKIRKFNITTLAKEPKCNNKKHDLKLTKQLNCVCFQSVKKVYSLFFDIKKFLINILSFIYHAVHKLINYAQLKVYYINGESVITNCAATKMITLEI